MKARFMAAVSIFLSLSALRRNRHGQDARTRIGGPGGCSSRQPVRGGPLRPVEQGAAGQEPVLLARQPIDRPGNDRCRRPGTNRGGNGQGPAPGRLLAAGPCRIPEGSRAVERRGEKSQLSASRRQPTVGPEGVSLSGRLPGFDAASAMARRWASSTLPSRRRPCGKRSTPGSRNKPPRRSRT